LDPPHEPENLTDAEIVERVRAGEVALFELVMRRYNQRVYRAVRSIVSSDAEAEDVMQEAYVKAYANLGTFEFRARLSTWLIKIAVYEAFARKRRARRFESFDESDLEHPAMASPVQSPEQLSSNRELSGFLEQAILGLPEGFRAVFVLRAVEELSAAETAEILDIPEETVKTRLHRAKGRLQTDLLDRLGTSLPSVFGFHAVRCDRVVAHVLARIRGCRE
jgi:RNA polymerase sigma-70 factor (ECF subfamily)